MCQSIDCQRFFNHGVWTVKKFLSRDNSSVVHENVDIADFFENLFESWSSLCLLLYTIIIIVL